MFYDGFTVEDIERGCEKIREIARKAGIHTEDAKEGCDRMAEAMREAAESIKEKEEEIQEAKMQAEKTFPCRICGTRYMNKAEAKACARSHDWQNRRGRR